MGGQHASNGSAGLGCHQPAGALIFGVPGATLFPTDDAGNSLDIDRHEDTHDDPF
jgi:hypothetical protein